jgi:fibronectin type 3 domain-containing protein
MILSAILVLSFAVTINAQTVAEKKVSVSWDAGTEPDLQYYQLYVSGNGSDFVPAGGPIFFNPNDPESPARLTSDYTFAAPAGATTTKRFRVTAIDTSGNESEPSEAVSVAVDNEPPGAPAGLRVGVLIDVTQ